MAFTSKHFDFTGKLPLTNVEEVMKHSVLTPDLVKLNKLPEFIKRDQKKTKPKYKDVPQEVLTDLSVLRMRAALDSKRFYKKNSLKGLNLKDVQVGKVIDSPADFYSSRLPKKLRKRTLVDELLADQDFKRDVKKKFVENVLNNKAKFKNHFRRLQRESRQKEKQKRRQLKRKEAKQNAGESKKGTKKSKSKKTTNK